jgi:hypothetical protein
MRLEIAQLVVYRLDDDGVIVSGEVVALDYCLSKAFGGDDWV